MSTPFLFVRRSTINASAADLYDWHLRPGAFLRLQPPWEKVKLIRQSGPLGPGCEVEIGVNIGPIEQRWVAQHADFVPGEQFRDIQISGPFAKFEHTHRMRPLSRESSELEDSIEYIPPLGWPGRWFGQPIIAGKLDRMFRYRHDITKHDLETWTRYKEQPRLKILVAGAGGLVGTALIPFLTTQGHSVTRLVRRAAGASDEISWDPARGEIDATKLEGFDAVIHLGGKNIAGQRWTPAVKQRILESRTIPTRFLAQTLRTLQSPPACFICASAIGFYGDTGINLADESVPAGEGFLADVCRAWEAACEPLLDSSTRVVNMRIGVVLTPLDAALAKLLLPFQLGLGGPIGSGRQYWSWITLDDVIGALHHALVTPQLQGPVNTTAPQPVTNQEFGDTLARVLSRPAFLPAPAFAMRTLLGEMAEALLLASLRVQPDRLLTTGYQFRHPNLETGLRHLLGAWPTQQH